MIGVSDVLNRHLGGSRFSVRNLEWSADRENYHNSRSISSAAVVSAVLIPRKTKVFRLRIIAQNIRSHFFNGPPLFSTTMKKKANEPNRGSLWDEDFFRNSSNGWWLDSCFFKKNMLNMAGRFISPLVLNLTVSPLTSQLNTKLFSSHQSVNIFYIREEKSNMRWKLIVVLQSIFIIHYFDLNPIWPSFLERIWEPEGVRLGFQFFLEMTCLEVI